MRRADRLMTLITLLKDGQMHRGPDLAARLGISLRTLYRDMDTIAASGVPIEGERGVGYRVTAALTLPPINLTMLELEALHLGLSAVAQSGDPELTGAATALAAKLDAALPEDGAPGQGAGLAVYPFADAALGFRWLPQIKQAIRARQKLVLTLSGMDRTVRPLRLDYWGRVWTCLSWCETTRDFAELRLDRIESLRLLPQLFIDEPGKGLADYAAR